MIFLGFPCWPLLEARGRVWAGQPWPRGHVLHLPWQPAGHHRQPQHSHHLHEVKSFVLWQKCKTVKFVLPYHFCGSTTATLQWYSTPRAQKSLLLGVLPQPLRQHINLCIQRAELNSTRMFQNVGICVARYFPSGFSLSGSWQLTTWWPIPAQGWRWTFQSLSGITGEF